MLLCCLRLVVFSHFEKCFFYAANWLSFDKFICLYFVFSQLHYMYSAEDIEQRNLQSVPSAMWIQPKILVHQLKQLSFFC